MKKKLTPFSLTLLLSLVYFTSYITRKNFSVIITSIIDGTGFSENLLGIALTCLSITYGVGQVVNGFIGDIIKPQNLIFCGLIIVSLMNLLLPLVSVSIALMCICWAINGFAQAMLWPPIVRILATTLNDKQYNASIIIVSASSSLATIFLSIVAKHIIVLFKSWTSIFYFSTVIGFMICVIWFFVKDSCSDFENKKIIFIQKEKSTENKFSIPKIAVFPLFFIFATVILQGMLRDGIEPLLPIYLKQMLNVSSEDAIIITIAPSILSIVFYYISGWVYKKFFTNEVTCASLIFSLASIAGIALLFLFNVGKIAPLICLTLITSLMHGINLMINSYVPKRFVKYGNVATFAGIINACTYIGSAIAYTLFLSITDWYITVIVCTLIAVLGTACGFIASKKWNKIIKDTSNN